MSENDDETTTIPLWFVGISVGVASYVVHKNLLSNKKFPVAHQYKHVEGDDYSASYPKGDKYWVTNPWDSVKIRFSRRGGASEAPVTCFQVFEAAVAKAPTSKWFMKEYLDSNGNYVWKHWTRQEVFDVSQDVARAFIALGLEQWQSVAIIGFNAPEWHFADIGAIYAGGLVAGIYTTNNVGQCKYVANHSRAGVVVVEDAKQLAKILSIRDEIKTLKKIIIYDPYLASNSKVILDANQSKSRAEVVHWREFIKLGRDPTTKQSLSREMRKRIDSIEPGNCCTLIYTSGTTGPPKAVMLSHDNITWGSKMFWQSAPHFDAGPHASVSYLPMSHAAAQCADIWYPLTKMAFDCTDWQLYFARPDALKGTLKLTLKAARPTFFFGVPRVWEKFYEAIKAQVAKNPPSVAKSMLITKLKSVALEANRNCEVGGSRNVPTGYWLAQKLLFPKLKDALGFDRCQGFYTGAAPVHRQILEFFASVGINVLELYGMSECSGVHTLGIEHHNMMGTVGCKIKGCQTQIQHNASRDSKGHGEICIRGRHVMMGYMYDKAKTKSTIDDQGWLHSGDVGEVDENHLLRITGRIKELIITAGGENIAPVPIEDYIKAECPAISNVILIGDHKKYLVVLITLKVLQNKDSFTFTNQLTDIARKVDDTCRTVKDARRSKNWKDYIDSAIKKYNADSNCCVSRAQRIQYFRILDGDLGVESGELTATLKLKRSVVAKKFENVIESMFSK